MRQRGQKLIQNQRQFEHESATSRPQPCLVARSIPDEAMISLVHRYITSLSERALFFFFSFANLCFGKITPFFRRFRLNDAIVYEDRARYAALACKITSDDSRSEGIFPQIYSLERGYIGLGEIPSELFSIIKIVPMRDLGLPSCDSPDWLRKPDDDNGNICKRRPRHCRAHRLVELRECLENLNPKTRDDTRIMLH